MRNPDFLFNNLVHYETFAEFLTVLLDASFKRFNCFPIGSVDPLRLREIVERLRTYHNYKGEVAWQNAGPLPFAIDTTEAEAFGFRPRSVDYEINRWLRSDNK